MLPFRQCSPCSIMKPTLRLRCLRHLLKKFSGVVPAVIPGFLHTTLRSFPQVMLPSVQCSTLRSCRPLSTPADVRFEPRESEGAVNERLRKLQIKLEELGIQSDVNTAGQNTRAICPMCGGGDSKERSFSLFIGKEGKHALWSCFRAKCGWKGCVTAFQGDERFSVKQNSGLSVGALKCKEYRSISEEDLHLEPLCSECRNVVWLPGAISEANVTGNVCPRCTPGPVFLIQFKFRRLEIPPNYDVDYLGCVGGCDDILRELIEICGTGSRNATPMTARGEPSVPLNNQRRHNGTNLCTSCRQTGHSSNDCSSQPSRSGRSQSSGAVSSRNGNILCDCGEPCALKTANTEKNRGRNFYCCQARVCNTFIWEDNQDNGAAQGRGMAHGSGGRSSSTTGRRGGRGRGRGRGQRGAQTDGLTFVSATGEQVPIACYVCGDISHFANACPNRGRRINCRVTSDNQLLARNLPISFIRSIAHRFKTVSSPSIHRAISTIAARPVVAARRVRGRTEPFRLRLEHEPCPRRDHLILLLQNPRRICCHQKLDDRQHQQEKDDKSPC
ncbi:hypothetical protein HPP92_005917 [Vanilla planifolia]|uniref:CCHC-type domain-containing protein n=1 Tax=Vanilla planifolia TaxID=51239 RepID=A0A835V9I2_VANPL|nr:hypothetical protein HPP92_005917 [Vanilla planifolia]